MFSRLPKKLDVTECRSRSLAAPRSHHGSGLPFRRKNSPVRRKKPSVRAERFLETEDGVSAHLVPKNNLRRICNSNRRRRSRAGPRKAERNITENKSGADGHLINQFPYEAAGC